MTLSNHSVLNTQSSVLSPSPSPKPLVLNPQSSVLLITGGCGFIGVNFIDFMLKKGFTQFRILDNLSVGSKESLEPMLTEHGTLTKEEADNRTTYNLAMPLSPELRPQSSALSPQSSNY